MEFRTDDKGDRLLSRREFNGLAASLGVAMGLGGISTASAQAPAQIYPDDAEMKKMLKRLLALAKQRHSVSKGYPVAADFVKSTLSHYGYRTEYQTVTVGDGSKTYQGERKVSFQNVIASGPNPLNGTITYIFCAHLDTTRNSPGANDNGSGVVALLELARCLTYYYDYGGTGGVKQIKYPIQFLFLGGEEMGFLGSNAYCKTSIEDFANYRAINLDTIGAKSVGSIQYAMEYRFPNVTAGDPGSEILNLAGYFSLPQPAPAPPMSVIETRLLLPAPNGEATKFPSDHLAFNDVSVPVASITQKDRYPYLHTPADTLNKLDPDAAGEATLMTAHAATKYLHDFIDAELAQ